MGLDLHELLPRGAFKHLSVKEVTSCAPYSNIDSDLEKILFLLLKWIDTLSILLAPLEAILAPSCEKQAE